VAGCCAGADERKSSKFVPAVLATGGCEGTDDKKSNPETPVDTGSGLASSSNRLIS